MEIDLLLDTRPELFFVLFIFPGLVVIAIFQARKEKEDIVALRAENDKLRRENSAMTKALEQKACASYGGLGEDACIKDQKLCAENAHLKEEVCLNGFYAMTYKAEGFT